MFETLQSDTVLMILEKLGEIHRHFHLGYAAGVVASFWLGWRSKGRMKT